METTRFERFSWILATVFGAGYLPQKLGFKLGAGAGTVASLLTLLVVQVPMVLLSAGVFVAAGAAMVAFIIGLIIVGPADNYIRKKEGSQARHDGVQTNHDFNQNCVDEVVGQLVAGIPVFWLYTNQEGWSDSDRVTPWTMFSFLFLAFLAFRIFDITKWLGIKWIENELGKSALGILWDDVAAAIYAWLVVCVAIGLEYGFLHYVSVPILMNGVVLLIFVFLFPHAVKYNPADDMGDRK